MLGSIAIRNRCQISKALPCSSFQTPTNFVFSRRTFADVEVDHARAQWKTYGNLDAYTPGKHHILTFNKISPIGLQKFPSSFYEIFAGDTEAGSKSNAHAILLRSHKLKEEEVAHTVRAIAR
jgi:D-3-phosphoglycerate dehydrogenase / 2-oxoglutarate reductase